jgi:uncharacterized protein (TIGR03083 family)
MVAVPAELRIDVAPAAEAVERAGRRVVELLRRADPERPTVGLEWSIGELAAHLAARTELFAGYLAGTASPQGEIREIGANNERQVREAADVPFEVRVERIGEHVDAFVRGTRGRLGTDPYPWYSGLTLDVATGTGIALAELLVHGHDAARTMRRPWPIAADDARTILRASFVLAPWYVDPTRASGTTTYRILVRGGPRVRFRIADGAGSVEPVDGPADCAVRADPVALLLVSYGRTSRWRAAATGGLFATGRRPWRALAFSKAFLPP